MKFSFEDLAEKLPLPPNEIWREGVPFIEAFSHGTMSLELFVPRGEDLQSPHTQDEIYIIIKGTGEFAKADQRFQFKAGDALFVPAGIPHRFENFSSDLAVWVIFYGAKGGEKGK
jgi:mannose-6-phosphate isomerase-like protein (cupin superfamily)